MSTAHGIRAWAGRLALISSLALAACAGSGSGSGDIDEITLTFSLNLPETHPNGHAQFAFAEYVEEESDGKITVEHFFNASLMPAEEALTGVSSGTADIALTNAGYFPQELPISNWVDNLGAVQGFVMPSGFLAGSAALSDLYNSSEPIQQEWADHGVKVLTAGGSPSFKIFCNRQISSADEAKGMRTRVGGGVWLPEIEAMGMEPVSLPTTEVYEALQRGIVDCGAFDTVTSETLGVWEIAKHILNVNMSSVTSSVVVMGLDQWNSLSEESQNIIVEASQVYWLGFLEAYLPQIAEFGQLAEESNMEVHDVPELNALLDQHHDDRVASMSETSPEALEQPQEVIAQYEELVEKWQQLLAGELGLETPDEADRVGMTEEYDSLTTFPFDDFSELFREHAE